MKSISTKEAVIELLARNRGEYISGEEIGKRLNISRSAVWKGITALKAGGYNIVSVTNRGYMLQENDDNLSKTSIIDNMSKKGIWNDIIILDTVDSTNDYAKRLAVDGNNKDIIILANSQTNGKGRLSRSFSSPQDTGIYLSFLLRPNIPISEVGLITAYAAVSTARAIYDITGVQCLIKWVNDLFLGDKKVCGILTEGSVSFEMSSLSHAVLGIGINVTPPKSGFDGEAKSVAGVISNYSNGYRNKIIARIADYVSSLEQEIVNRNFLEYYRLHSYILGKDIYIINGEQRTLATAIDIDNQAGLVVKLLDGSVKTLNSGEVSVRLK